MDNKAQPAPKVFVVFQGFKVRKEILVQPVLKEPKEI